MPGALGRTKEVHCDWRAVSMEENGLRARAEAGESVGLRGLVKHTSKF